MVKYWCFILFMGCASLIPKQKGFVYDSNWSVIADYILSREIEDADFSGDLQMGDVVYIRIDRNGDGRCDLISRHWLLGINLRTQQWSYRRYPFFAEVDENFDGIMDAEYWFRANEAKPYKRASKQSFTFENYLDFIFMSLVFLMSVGVQGISKR